VRVFITGASSGIGAALARHYGRSGASLGLLSRRAIPGEPFAYQGDVADTEALKRIAADFIARCGVPDLVIANAGIGAGTLGEDIGDIEKLRRIVDVNLTGMAATLAVFAPEMKTAGRGTLAGIASVAGFRGLAGNGAYCASKAAAIAWLESLRVELTGSGVSVVCLCPGYIDTPMTQVNRFRMPFLLSADEAARRIARAIAARRRVAVIPWQMAAASALLRILPGFIYDRLAARAPRKPRNVAL
jgi:short-subunit dehydrogenase